MRSEVSKRILDETPQEAKDRVNESVSKFLEMKNINIIRKVSDAIDQSVINSQMKERWIEFEKEIRNTPLQCELHNNEVFNGIRLTHIYHVAFLNMIRLIRDGSLVYKEKE